MPQARLTVYVCEPLIQYKLLSRSLCNVTYSIRDSLMYQQKIYRNIIDDFMTQLKFELSCNSFEKNDIIQIPL